MRLFLDPPLQARKMNMASPKGRKGKMGKKDKEGSRYICVWTNLVLSFVQRLGIPNALF